MFQKKELLTFYGFTKGGCVDDVQIDCASVKFDVVLVLRVRRVVGIRCYHQLDTHVVEVC